MGGAEIVCGKEPTVRLWVGCVGLTPAHLSRTRLILLIPADRHDLSVTTEHENPRAGID